jgi:hypothetical protein
LSSSFCRIFVRALFTIQGLDDTNYSTTTTSDEVTIARGVPLIDLLPQPVLIVTRVGLQMVMFCHIKMIF